MPPYRNEGSPAWGRHYGQDFGGSSVILPVLVLTGTAANTPANCARYSLDGGLTWPQCTVPDPGATSGLWGIAWSPSLEYAVITSSTGGAGGVFRSFDGITWATFAANLSNGNWRRMVRNNDDSLFVVVGIGGTLGQRAATSPDGITWTLRTTPNAGGSTSWQSIVVNPVTGVIHAAASASFTQPFIRSLDGGITWAYSGSIASDSPQDLYAMDAVSCALNGYTSGYIRATGGATGSLNDYFTLDDGVTWQTVTNNPASSEGTCVACNDLSVVRGDGISGLWRIGPTQQPPPDALWTNPYPAGTTGQPSGVLWSEEWGCWLFAAGNVSVHRSEERDGSSGWSTITPGSIGASAITNIKPLFIPGAI